MKRHRLVYLMKNEKINLPDSVKEGAEMYALGAISLTQVAEEVEKFPLSEQALMMSRAMIHAELYYREYEEWCNAHFE